MQQWSCLIYGSLNVSAVKSTTTCCSFGSLEDPVLLLPPCLLSLFFGAWFCGVGTADRNTPRLCSIHLMTTTDLPPSCLGAKMKVTSLCAWVTFTFLSLAMCINSDFLGVKYCNFLIIKMCISGGLVDLMQVWTTGFRICPSCLRGNYRRCCLRQAYLAFNSSTQLIILWVDREAWLIYYYFVLERWCGLSTLKTA